MCLLFNGVTAVSTALLLLSAQPQSSQALKYRMYSCQRILLFSKRGDACELSSRTLDHSRQAGRLRAAQYRSSRIAQ